MRSHDFEARRRPSPVVSVARVTVAGMSDHRCVYFEDVADYTCECGERAVWVLDDDGVGTLVPLDDRPAPVTIQNMPLSA